jgi:hypothetical protein
LKQPPQPGACLEQLALRCARRDAQQIADLFVCVSFDIVQHDDLSHSFGQCVERALQIEAQHHLIAACARLVRVRQCHFQLHPPLTPPLPV